MTLPLPNHSVPSRLLPYMAYMRALKRTDGQTDDRLSHLPRFFTCTSCKQASFDPGFLCWSYASRLVAAGMYFFVAVYLNALATMVATHRNPYAMMLDRSGEPLSAHTLPDLGHDLWAFLLTRWVNGYPTWGEGLFLYPLRLIARFNPLPHRTLI